MNSVLFPVCGASTAVIRIPSSGSKLCRERELKCWSRQAKKMQASWILATDWAWYLKLNRITILPLSNRSREQLPGWEEFTAIFLLWARVLSLLSTLFASEI